MHHGGGEESNVLPSLQPGELPQRMRRRIHLPAMQLRPPIIPK